MTGIVTANLRFSKSPEKMKDDLRRLMQSNPGMIGFQEVSAKRARVLKALLNREGYGIVVVNDVPIAYKKDRFRLRDSNHRTLAGGKGLRHVRASWAAFEDRKTGATQVITNAHLIRSSTHEKLNAHQIRQLADMQRDLRRRFGGKAEFHLTGDLNTSSERDLKPLREAGLDFYRAGPTGPKGGRPDWIGSTLDAENRRVIGNLRSDHNALRVGFDFGGASRGGKKADGKPGGKSDGRPNKGGKNKAPQGAYDILRDFFKGLDIEFDGQIRAVLRDAMENGYGPDQINLILPDLQETKAFKKRFPGWDQRIKNGYNQLDLGEYLQLENSYHRIMQEAGLPAGFYDDPSDFGNWIGNNVSPDEVQNRVGLATEAAQKIDPTARNLMAKHYGLTTGDIASYFLDQNRALPVIQRQFNAANVASWASRAGFNVGGMGRYEDLVDSGITPEQAAQSYGSIKSLADTAGSIAGVYGETFSQQDAEDDVFFGKDEKRRKLFTQERSTFSGSSRGATGSAQRTGY